MPVCLEEPQILKDVRLQTCVEVTQVEKPVTAHAAVQDVVGEQGRGPDPIGAHTHLKRYWRYFQHVYKNSDGDFYF